MARPRSNHKVVCYDKDCPYFRKEKGKDLIKKGRNTAGHQKYYCLHCKKYSVETKGTPLYKRHLKERKIKDICKSFVETQGIRATGRMVNVHRDTVMSLINSIGEHALEMTGYLVHDLGLKSYEVDELFAVVKKNRKNLSRKAMNSLDKARQLLQQL